MRRAAGCAFALVALAAWASASPALAQTPLWSRSVYGPANAAAFLGDGQTVTRTVAMDGAGNVVVVGSTGSGSAADFLTTKLSAGAGAVAWQKTFAGTAGGPDRAMAVALDASGNAVVAGLTANASGNDDIKVVKYAASNGAVLWEKTFDSGAYDGAYAVAVDPSGDAIVGAESTNAAGNVDVRLLKLAGSTGALLWDRLLDNGRDDYVSDLALDSAGNPVVAGVSVNASGDNDFAIFKCDGASGAVLWRRAFDSGAADQAYSVAVDRAGNAFVTGFSTGATIDYRTLKLAAADGSIAWQRTYDGGGNDFGQSVAVDSLGNAVVTGYSVNAAGNFDIVTLKYAALDGATLWQKSLDGGGEDYGYAVAVDASDDAIVSGSSSASGHPDWKIVAYAPADGSTLFQRSYAGSGGGDDEAFGLAISAAGIAVAGSAVETGASAGIHVELLPAPSSAASITSPALDGTLPGSTVTFQWNDAGASLYQVWVGSSVGTHDVGYYPTSGTRLTSASVSGLPTDGRKLYVRLYSSIGGSYVYRDFTYTAAGTGATPASSGPASITSPADGSKLPGSGATFQWTNAGASLYQLWLGNSQGAYDIGYFPASGTTSTATSVTGIPTDGRTIHARLYSNIGGAYAYRDFTYTAAGSGSSPSAPAAASITSPAPGGTLGGTSVTFQWNDSGAALYQLWVGNAPGGFDIGYFPAAGTTATSIVATGLPTDGRGLYVRLYSAVNGAWQFRDFTYIASGSASAGGGAPGSPNPAAISSPANGSALSGSTVTFQWNDAGASLYQLWVGTTPGAFDIGYYPATGTTATSIAATRLPTDGRALYVRLYSAFGATWYYRDFTFRAGP